jgi:hypothetical protein
MPPGFPVLAITLAAGLAQNPAPRKETALNTASGTFEVKVLPPADHSLANDGYTRLSLDKTFTGSLTGTSRVEMMATSDGKSPSGGYVALERFTGALAGKSGGFVMQHSGTMSPGKMEIHVVITPGTGTGGLAGISGTLEIRREGKQHFYTLRYELPGSATQSSAK